jgi:hypothetical protein
LKKKLNKIDIGIATRCAEIALRHEGKRIQSITAMPDRKRLEIEIRYSDS